MREFNTSSSGVRISGIIGCLFLFLYSFVSDATNIRQITNQDGLSNSAILSILQDSEGYVWFGTCDGLNLFNGLNVQVYKPTEDNRNLSGNLIEGILEAEDNVLWIHTNYGLNRLDKKKWKLSVFNQFKGLYFIEKDNKNTIFIINQDKSIFYYNKTDGLFKKIDVPDISYRDIISFTITSEDQIHIFTNDGRNLCFAINRLADGNVTLSKKNAFSHPAKLIYCFHEKNNPDIIYFIDDTDTLYEYNFITKKKYYIYNLGKEINNKGLISSIIKYHDDYFIGFKTNGLLQLKNTSDKVDNYQVEDAGIKSGVFCLAKDRYQDLIWIGTDGHGVYMYSNDIYTMRSYTFLNFGFKIDKPVRALFMDQNNGLWVGTKGDGIALINNFSIDKNFSKENIEYINAENSSLTDNSIYSFEKSRHNLLWIGAELGLNYYSFSEKKVNTLHFQAGGQPVKYIHGICELNDSTLWISTVGTGIIKAHLKWNNNIPLVTKAERLTIYDGSDFYNYFFSIYKDPDNSKIWFGNRGYGAYFVTPDENKLHNVNFDNLCTNQTVNDIYAIQRDSHNNIWFGTSFGLVKQSPDGISQLLNQRDGLPNNTVHTILSDADDNLWLSTNRGIVKFNTILNTFQTYNQHNGLQITEFSDGAAFKDSKTNNMYFGGINGFIVISETGLPQQEFSPPIYFGDLFIFGNKENLHDYVVTNENQEILKLTYKQNFFSLSFTALDYINGNDYNYYYQLEGLSKQWIDNGSSNTVFFTSIPPGEYVLHAKYKNKLTGVESQEYSLSILISPPWYMSWWAYLIYIILIQICVGFAIRTIYVRNYRKKKNAMRKLQQQHIEEVHESKLRFFTNIAHEFCTPLTLIHGPCSHILTYSGADNYIRKNTLLIQRNAERMNDLIQNLIDFRRLETGNQLPIVQEIDVAVLISDISDSFGDLANSRNIKLKKDIQSHLQWNSDRNFLYTIVSNLISNAFKYTYDHGCVDVEVYEENGDLYLIITNTGKGIEEENLIKIFDRYMILDDFENQNKTKGSSRNGLGLAISYNMVKLLNGTIEVESVMDEKTTFVVCLPPLDITEIDESLKIKQSLPEIKPVSDHETIIELPKYTFDPAKRSLLIIEDDIEILWFICEIFKEEYNVIPVNNPMTITDVLLEIQPDIIICDVMMPEIDGITLAKGFKSDKKTAHIPLILISAKHSTEEQIEGLATGAQMYIGKPFEPDYLKASVRTLLSGKENLKNYLDSPISAFVLQQGKLTHKEHIKFITDIFDIINKNINDPKLSAQFIARELNMSPRHMYRKLNEIGSESPSEMIKESRMHIAKKLLLNSQMTIDEIIYKSGFSNRATFFRLFAQKYGCTPKDYREQNTDIK